MGLRERDILNPKYRCGIFKINHNALRTEVNNNKQHVAYIEFSINTYVPRQRLWH